MTGPDTLIGGRYRLVRQLAAGGMGSVWEALDERLHRPVAVKQLHVQPGLSPQAAQLAGSRALREARITARLHHPNAVPVYDVVDQDGLPCLIMQYLPSTSLAELLRQRGPQSPAWVAQVGAQVAAALAAAHELGIVHRDVKPGNVLIASDGTAKVTDFGISHALGDISLTSTGLVTGTPAFLAPEVARGAETAYSADVFGLGATLYNALEGQPPFGQDDNPMAMLHRAASGQIIPPRRSGPLTPLLLRMLAPDPNTRPQMAAVAHTLGALAADINAVTPLTRQLPPTAATERLSAAPVPVGGAGGRPIAPTATLPAAGNPAPKPRPRPEPKPNRTGWIAAVVVLVVVIAALVGLLLVKNHGRGDSAGSTVTPPPNSAGQLSASSTPPSATNSSASSTSTDQSSTDQTSPNPPSTDQSSANPPSPPGGPTDAQLAQAIIDYYALLPGNTDQGWNRLTKNYQHTTAKNRKSYDDFWASVDSVSVSNVTGSAPSSASALVTLKFSDGHTEIDQTDFKLVADGGTLKIDASQVQNSQRQ